MYMYDREKMGRKDSSSRLYLITLDNQSSAVHDPPVSLSLHVLPPSIF